MSVELEPSGVPVRECARSIESIARSVKVDPRVTALVPGFSAPFFQAGLAGYSDAPMRLVARRHGCPYCVTEALLDRTLIQGGRGRRKEDPNLLARRGAIELEAGEELGTIEGNVAVDPAVLVGTNAITRWSASGGLDDHPLAGQIMGSDPDEMAEAAELMVSMGYDVIDVNLACPVKKMRKASRGGHCLVNVDHSTAILRAVRSAVPTTIPCSLKLRRAFDDTEEMARNFERIFNAAYEMGYCWATVHCRTVVQKYHGPGRWEFLTDLTDRHRDKVIFGSGDIWNVNDIFLMLELTGVSGVAVARGCIGNPWIFRQARQLMAGCAPVPPTIEEQRETLLDHFELSVALHGERTASRMMRKFGIKFAAHHPQAEQVKAEFIRCRDVREWHEVVARQYREPLGADLAADQRAVRALSTV